MDEQRENRIRLRAYAIWQSEVCPDGRHQEHWKQACAQIEMEDGSAYKEAPRTEPPPPSAALRSR